MLDQPEAGELKFRVALADGRSFAAVLTVAADSCLLQARPMADDGRPLGPGEAVAGRNDQPRLGALLRPAGTGIPAW